MNRHVIFVMLLLLMVPLGLRAQMADSPFITLWDTELPASEEVQVKGNPVNKSDDHSIRFPIIGANMVVEYQAADAPDKTAWVAVPGGPHSTELGAAMQIVFPAKGRYYVRVQPQGISGYCSWAPGAWDNVPYGDIKRLVRIVSWGSTLWAEDGLKEAFRNCENLISLPYQDPEFPSAVLAPQGLRGSLENLFQMCEKLSVPRESMNGWDVSQVTNMDGMFAKCKRFNGNVASWNVGNVANMYYMFSGCEEFNADLSQWNVGSCEKFDGMFTNCKKFNSNLSGWDIAKAKSLTMMFSGCEAFNGDISTWNTANVTSMAFTFKGCSTFNGDISAWDVSKVASMMSAFEGCKAFDQDLSGWNPKELTGAFGLFNYSGLSVSNWDKLLVGWGAKSAELKQHASLSATGRKHTAAGKVGLEQLKAIGWVITDDGMLTNPVTITFSTSGGSNIPPITVEKGQPVAKPSNPTRTDATFEGWYTDATYTNPYIFGTPVNENITIYAKWGAVGCEPFITEWDTSLPASEVWVGNAKQPKNDDHTIYLPIAGTGLTVEFRAVDAANKDSWTAVPGGPHTVETGEALRIVFPSLGKYYVRVKPEGVKGYRSGKLDAGKTYLYADVERLVRVVSWGAVAWNGGLEGAFIGCSNLATLPLANDAEFADAVKQPKILEGSLAAMFWHCTKLASQKGTPTEWSMGDWDVSSVTDVHQLFDSCVAFEGDLSQWRTGLVKDMHGLFANCEAFNGDLSSWDVAKVENMERMFSGCKLFNGNLSGWNTASVQNMAYMFLGCTAFNQPLGSWNIEQVAYMNGMLCDCAAFDQNLSVWKPKQLTSADNMLDRSGLSSDNWDNLLVDWARLSSDLRHHVTLGAKGRSHSVRANSAVQTLEGIGWIINDDNRADRVAVKWEDPEHGIIKVKDSKDNTINNGQLVDLHSEITITAEPEQDYRIKLLKVNGVDHPSGAKFTVESEVQISAEFEFGAAQNYTVTFTVKDDEGAVVGAFIEINGQALTTKEGGIATTDLPNGAYPYTVKKAGYDEFTGNLEVQDAPAAQTITLVKTAVPTYTVTFTVKDAEGAAIDGATIEINEQSLTTNTAGIATISLPNDAYPYTAKRDGYEDKRGIVTVADAAVGEEVVLDKKTAQTCTVTFTVKDANGTAIEGATIEVNGQSLITKDGGIATISLPNGAYPYTVKKAGYRNATGNVTVDGDAVSQAVTLQRTTVDAVESSLLAEVAAYPNPCQSTLNLRNVANLADLCVVNALGQVMLALHHSGTDELQIPVEPLPAGVYFLQLTDTRGGVRILRFTKR